MKRKITSIVQEAVSMYTRSKKPRLVLPLIPNRRNNIWVSATHLRNYIRKDTLVDWLKIKKTTGFYFNKKNDTFQKFLMKKGLDFEEKVINYIKNNKMNVVTVFKDDFPITEEHYKKTIELMKNGTDIIHSAPVKHSDNTGGIVDILIRSDKLNKLVDECPLTDTERYVKAPNLNGNYHYVVIDIKFSTIPLKIDGKLILNSGNFPAYKVQTWIYTKAVGEIQGLISRYAFIMGRRFNYEDKFNCFSKLGVVDFEYVDKKYINLSKEAIKWVRNVKRNGYLWSVNPPSIPELYPNMCIDSGVWNKEKEIISKNIGEITAIWNCGFKNREIALTKSIKSWRDPNCNSNNIGIGGNRGLIVDKILSINRQNKDKIRPSKIKNNVLNWKNKGNEVFVDFETLIDFSENEDIENQSSKGIIFMIGVGWEENDKWIYKNFTCNSSSFEEEYRIMNEFQSFLKDKNYPDVYYWHAEKYIWKSAENREFEIFSKKNDYDKTKNILKQWKNITYGNWKDLSNVFKTEPIVIKDCFKFGLKEISKAMYSHGLINTELKSECKSGTSAIVNAWKYYNTNSDKSIIEDIKNYNEFDCKVLWDILGYLRKNHT